MSALSRLALEVNEFNLVGCFGEPTWGQPKDVEVDKRVKEWTEGLRGDGGGGYVGSHSTTLTLLTDSFATRPGVDFNL